MPTGYTDKIKDGITFEQFIMSCARAFGALIEMRDDPTDAKIPDEFKPSDYYIKELEKANAELVNFTHLSKLEIQEKANEEYKQAMIEYRRRKQENIDLFNAYNSMLVQVENWNPPSSDHIELKNFMISQIRESIKFDCYEPDMPAPKTGETWAVEKLESIVWDIEYYTKENEEEIERINGRNKWVRQLRESINITTGKEDQTITTNNYKEV